MEKWYLQDIYNVIRAMDEMSARDKNCKREILDLHENDMKKLLSFYRHLKNENRQCLREMDQICHEKICEDMAYALVYLDVYDPRVDMRRMCAAMDDVGFLYGLSGMIERGLVLVRRFVPKKGKIYSDIIHEYFCGDTRRTDEEVIDILPEWISRRQYYREKREAIRWMGLFFFEVVIPRMRRDLIKHSQNSRT